MGSVVGLAGLTTASACPGNSILRRRSRLTRKKLGVANARQGGQLKPRTWATVIIPWLLLACLESQSAEWYKGNTHTHTSNSGGDSTPDEVAKWYRENGYAFVVFTDHEMITNVSPLNA